MGDKIYRKVLERHFGKKKVNDLDVGRGIDIGIDALELRIVNPDGKENTPVARIDNSLDASAALKVFRGAVEIYSNRYARKIPIEISRNVCFSAYVLVEAHPKVEDVYGIMGRNVKKVMNALGYNFPKAR